MGNSDLCMVCRALAVNYKQFSSGAPDLLLIRVKKRRRRRKGAGNIDDHDGFHNDDDDDRGDDSDSDGGSDCQDDSHNTGHNAGNEDGIVSSDDVVDISLWIDSVSHDGTGSYRALLDRSVVVGETDQDKGISSSLSMLLNDEDYHYIFESLYIEVKGPSDHLSFRQRVWLHLLNSGCDVHDGDDGRSLSTSIPKAFVCQIEE